MVTAKVGQESGKSASPLRVERLSAPRLRGRARSKAALELKRLALASNKDADGVAFDIVYADIDAAFRTPDFPFFTDFKRAAIDDRQPMIWRSGDALELKVDMLDEWRDDSWSLHRMRKDAVRSRKKRVPHAFLFRLRNGENCLRRLHRGR